MIDAGSLVREHIREMPAYEPILPYEVLSQQLGIPPERLVKLDANENPYGPLPEARLALAEMPYAHIYPDPESRLLRKALAEYGRIPVECLLAGAGADELIDLVMRAVLEPGDALVTCPPTFGMYAFDGDVNRARVIGVPRRADFSVNVDAVCAAVEKSGARLMFLASPNNPDGGLLAPQAVERLLELPALLILDEAYVEFAPPGTSLLAEVPKRGNLAVLRTFSKWAGLAGLRVGYGAFPAGLLPHLWKIKQPYNVSAAASTAALASLQHAEKLEAIGRRLIDERARLYGVLEGVPYLRPYPSHANFILCTVEGRQAKELKLALAQRGILVRYFDKPGLRQAIRISVGLPEHTEALAAALNELM